VITKIVATLVGQNLNWRLNAKI